MDRLGGAIFGSRDNLLADQIALGGRRRPDMHRLIRLAHMQRPGIGIGVNGYCPHPEFPRGADDPAGDLAAIGNEEG